MTPLLWTVFAMFVFAVVVTAIEMSMHSYPRQKTKTLGWEVLGLLLNVAFAVWCAWVLFK